MDSQEKIGRADLSALRILRYPDPRLREVCTPVESFDEPLRALVERMFELMSAAAGVGLAAPQVGVTVRLFIAMPTLQAEDRRLYINPQIVRAEGSQEQEEGCLSFPGITCRLKRYSRIVIQARGLDGEVFDEPAEGLAARIFQHECDHLDGRLFVDRMGSVARLARRRALEELEKTYAEANG